MKGEGEDVRSSIRDIMQTKCEEWFWNEICMNKHGEYTEMTATIRNMIGMAIKEKSPSMVKFINGMTKFDSLEERVRISNVDLQ